MSSKATPNLQIPKSSTSVSVKILDLSTIHKLPANLLYAPPIPGLEYLDSAPSFSFLIEHESGEKVLFDLGIPKDLSALGPQAAEGLKKGLKEGGYGIDVVQDVAEALESQGIKRGDINAVIWSHTHWDHKGDVRMFPSTTDLVVGPDARKVFIEGDGNSELGGILPSDAKDRTVREPPFDPSFKIGQLLAYDYFSDGSFYLLNTPGHSVGHLCALARTTPSTFIFMGGDAAHHCAEYRPSKYVPMPSEITPNPVSTTERHVPFCPGSFFEDLNTQRGRDPKGPLYQPAWGYNMDEVLETIGKMQECDGDEDVFVILAHDASLRTSGNVPFFPKAVNDWKERGLGRDLKWAWIGDIKRALGAKL